MKSFFNAIPFALLLFIAAACGRTNEQKDSNETAEEANEEKFVSGGAEKNAEFVAEEVAANYGEIELAKLASQKSTNKEVKDVAQLLVTEHSKALQELQTLASQKSITVPSEPDDASKRTLDNMQEKDAAKDFDKDWCKEMVDQHEKTIKKYEDQLEKTEDADLKSWINKTLPHLRTHLEQVKACHDKLKDASK